MKMTKAMVAVKFVRRPT